MKPVVGTDKKKNEFQILLLCSFSNRALIVIFISLENQVTWLDHGLIHTKTY